VFDIIGLIKISRMRRKIMRAVDAECSELMDTIGRRAFKTREDI
jgi:hypothetical protein